MVPGSRPQYRVLVGRDGPMLICNKVTLCADLCRPPAPGRFPSISPTSPGTEDSVIHPLYSCQ
jgi:hypothetical protein